MKAFALIVFIALLAIANSYGIEYEWWNSSFHYRIPLEINSSNAVRENFPVEIEINFTQELQSLGISQEFNENSTRVIEYSNSGKIIQEMPSQFSKAGNFNSSSNAVGEIIFIMNGTTNPNSKRTFFIYFDTSSSIAKGNYSTSLNFSQDGEEFWLNNTEISLKIDTLRNENTSGIYFASNYTTVLFDVPPSQRTAEYIQYENGSSQFMFDLRNNYSLIENGPVRKIVEQTGDEAFWNNPEVKTQSLKIRKRYIIYENSSWIKIEQILIPNNSVTRFSDISAPEIDTDRALGSGSASLSDNTTDPYSWVSYINNNLGLGIINIDEKGTNSYLAYRQFPIRIGTNFSNTTFSSNISQTSVLVFNFNGTHNFVKQIRDSFAENLIISQNSSQSYEVNINLTSDLSVINRGEKIRFEATLNDSFNLTDSINLTLNVNTSNPEDDLVIEMQNLGNKTFAGNFTAGENHSGIWKATAKAYDGNFLLSTTSITFQVVNTYNENITLEKNVLFPNETFGGKITLKNYRNDTGISQAFFSCNFNLSISDLGDGNYTFNFTAPEVHGIYELECNATKFNNTGRSNTSFLVESEKTFIDVLLNPGTFKAENITSSKGQSFILEVKLNNSGNGTASSINITLDVNGPLSSNSTFGTCPNLSPGNSCLRQFNITVPESTFPGNYTINATASWKNPDNSSNSSQNNSVVVVLENPVLKVLNETVNFTVKEGNSNATSIFIENEGNSELKNVTLVCNGGFCENFTFSFNPNNFSIPGNSTQEVIINVSAPEGFAKGNYSSEILVNSSNNGNSSFNITIEVPESITWNLSQNFCSKTVAVNITGVVCKVNVKNTGNVLLEFNASPNSGNFTFINQSSFNLSGQEVLEFAIYYNTTNAPEGNFIINYSISSNGTPLNNAIQVNLTTVSGPLLEILTSGVFEQNETISIRANVTDFGESGISRVFGNLTFPNGTKIEFNMTNITQNSPGITSAWEYNLTETNQRGIYLLEIEVRDNINAVSSKSGSFKVKAKLIAKTAINDNYLRSENVVINYNLTDASGKALNASVKIEISNPAGIKVFSNTYAVENGQIVPNPTLPGISLSGMPLGNYTLTANTMFNDSIANETSTSSTTKKFSVYPNLKISFTTLPTWFLNEKVKFSILLYTEVLGDNISELESKSDINFTIYDPDYNLIHIANKSSFEKVLAGNNEILYNYSFKIPNNSKQGFYTAMAQALYSGIQIPGSAITSFNFTNFSGGPFDLIILSHESEVEQGDYQNFTIRIVNNGEQGQDVLLSYWISDSDGKIYDSVTDEAVFISKKEALDLKRALFIRNGQAPGIYYLNTELNYSISKPALKTSKTFEIIEKAKEVEQISAGGGGGGIGAGIKKEIVPVAHAKEEFKAIEINKISPEKLDIERGGIRYISFEINNPGTSDLSINVFVSGIDASWYEFIGPNKVKAKSKISGLLKIKVPENAKMGEYPATLKIISENVSAKEEILIEVFESKEALIEERIKKSEEFLKDIEDRASKLSEKKDLAEISAILEKANEMIILSKKYLKDKNLIKAMEAVEEAWNLIGKAGFILEAGTKENVIYKTLDLKLVYAAIFFAAIILAIYILKFRSYKRREDLMKIRKTILPGHFETHRESRIERKLDELKRELYDMINEIEEQFKKGEISKESYDEMKHRYVKELELVDMRVCPRCKHLNPEESSFCIKCGAKLKEPDTR